MQNGGPGGGLPRLAKPTTLGAAITPGLPVSVSPEVLSRFSRQFVMLYQSGVPALSVLETLAHQAEDARFGFVLLGVRWHVRSGRSLAHAMAPYRRAFPPLYIALVRAGEASGKLAHTMEYAARLMDAETRLVRQVQTAVTYPLMVVVVTALSAVLCTLLMLPFLAELAGDVHSRMPLTALVLSHLVSALQDARVLIGMPLLMLLSAWLMRCRMTDPNMRCIVHAALLRMPTLGRLLRGVILARMTRCLGLCLQAGLPLLSVLELCRGVAGNDVYERDLTTAMHGMRCGGSLSEHMAARVSLYTRAVAHMVATGEASSTLSRMAFYAADLLEQEVANALLELMQLLEPLLLVGLGLVVGFVALAAFQPLAELVGSMG